jgi:hypothetical protein
VKDISKGGEVKIQIKIEDTPRRKHMVFQGGAVLADLTKVMYINYICPTSNLIPNRILAAEPIVIIKLVIIKLAKG